MQLKKTCTIGCLFVCAALGQTEGGLKARVAPVRYPALAEQARIQGDVRLEVNSGVVTLVSGHPLLAPVAINNAKALGSLQGQTKLDMTYHFVIVDTNAYSVPTSTTVKIGNAFERAILRVLGFKTEKVVHGYRCEEGVAPASDIKIDGAAVEIWVYGRTFCLETSTAVTASNGPMTRKLAATLDFWLTGTDRIDELKNVSNRADGFVPFVALARSRVFLASSGEDSGIFAAFVPAPSPRAPFCVSACDIKNPSEGSDDA